MVAYYNRELGPLGLTAQQLIALGVLMFEEDISLGVFAKRVGVGKAAAASMVKRLEAMGLVTNNPHPSDARFSVLKVTDKARELNPKIQKKVSELEKTIESQFGASNLEGFAAKLSAFLDIEF
ncbi:MAG: MarR family transcriptional regulator [Desulfobacterales bacterium]|nr:MarR family transcriptional regulator [Desulfobacterales bacterium]